MSAAFWPLARHEVRAYLRHPLFIAGVLVNVLVCLAPIDARTSVALNCVVPAAAIGVVGIAIMAALTRRSDRLAAESGAAPVPERVRTLALAAACVVPLAVGLLWWAWAVPTFHAHLPPANGYPFGGHRGGGWIDTVVFAQGVLPCLGGPMLGLLVGRWTRRRGTPALVAVGVLAFCIVLQPLAPGLRRIRVISPWTQFGGPLGIPGDADRTLILSGSPGWWGAYLVGLCGLALLGALLHDRDAPRPPVLRAAAVVGALCVGALLLAMWTGTPHTIVNPLPSGA